MIKRDPLKIINTSSPDRGLQQLLEIWPKVHAAVPNSTLEWFYGFQLFDKFHAGNPASMQWKQKIVSQLSQDGIIKHGRMTQKELKQEMQTVGIWAYPTTFQEINCISAIKAQAYGCVPVVMNEAALKETVQFGIKIDGDIYDDEVKDLYTKELIWALQHPEWQEEVRKPMIEWAQGITWERVAKNWDNEFRGKQNFKVIEPQKNAIVKILDGYGG